jgi:hypothetical protein
MPWPSLARRARTNIAFLAATVILSLHTLPYRIMGPCPGDDSVERLVAGAAYTPYQYRVLLPAFVRAGEALHLIEPGTRAERGAFDDLELVALVLLGFVFRRYLSSFIHGDVVASVLALSIYVILPFNYFNYFFYPYDIPGVLFFTLGLILIRNRNWWLFYPVFALATFNRETSIFLVAAAAFALYDKLSARRLALLVGSQLVIWCVIKAGLWSLYRDNPSHGVGLFVFQFKVNVATIREVPLKSLAALSTWGLLWVAGAIWYRRIRDEFLRRNLWVVPLFVLAMFVFGFIVESRIYGEILPIVIAAFWVTFLPLLEQAAFPGRDAPRLAVPASL